MKNLRFSQAQDKVTITGKFNLFNHPYAPKHEVDLLIVLDSGEVLVYNEYKEDFQTYPNKQTYSEHYFADGDDFDEVLEGNKLGGKYKDFIIKLFKNNKMNVKEVYMEEC